MRTFFSLFTSIVFFVLLPGVVQAASLNLAPSSGSFAVGSNVVVTVFVNSPDRAVNAVSGTLSFPASHFEVTSVSKSGSVLSLWVQEPTYSNSQGRVSFEGITLNPGYTGTGGKIISVTFRVKSEGEGRIAFVSGSVLANDGQGTNIASSFGQANLTLVGKGGAVEQEPKAPVPVPAPTAAPSAKQSPVAPTIQSSSHPEPETWYAKSDVSFQWNVPTGTDSVRLLFDTREQSQPSITYKPAVRSRDITDVADGVWYLHLQFHNAQGWGAVTHAPVRIDTQPPEQLLIERVEDTEDAATFLLRAQDDLSGIHRFEIQTDGEPPQLWLDVVDGQLTFTTKALTPGTHTISVTAFDLAGNSLSGSEEFFMTATSTASGESVSLPETGLTVVAEPGWTRIPGWVLVASGFLLGLLGAFGSVVFWFHKRMPPLVARSFPMPLRGSTAAHPAPGRPVRRLKKSLEPSVRARRKRGSASTL